MLSKDEELDLAKKIKVGVPNSLNELIESNLRFVVKEAKEYRNLGLPFEDLLNEGNVGLIEAARRYDYTKGVKFITYAQWWIKKAILKAISENMRMVRIPDYSRKKTREVEIAEKILSNKLNRKPNREEISESLEHSCLKIESILKAAQKEISLDETYGEEKDATLSDFLADWHFMDPEKELFKREDNYFMKTTLSLLNDQEKFVLTYRFGLNGEKVLTLKEIGKMINMSRERVRQIETQAKLRLKKAFEKSRIIKSPSKKIFPLKKMQSVSPTKKKKAYLGRYTSLSKRGRISQ